MASWVVGLEKTEDGKSTSGHVRWKMEMAFFLLLVFWSEFSIVDSIVDVNKKQTRATPVCNDIVPFCFKNNKKQTGVTGLTGMNKTLTDGVIFHQREWLKRVTANTKQTGNWQGNNKSCNRSSLITYTIVIVVDSCHSFVSFSSHMWPIFFIFFCCTQKDDSKVDNTWFA